ncbi:MAG: 23S rRNA (adenine(2503)-C(2))-methyltransferase RlmN [Anaerolineae bacterium]|nr:23S rRNA (adenine(2503)-C(2))-methyltransferase RlmN [Anaerolineae bacterium]
MCKQAPNIYDLNLSELQSIFASLGQPAYRASQLWQGLYQQLWATPEEFTTFSKPQRQTLSKYVHFGTLSPKQTLQSKDGHTIKTLFKLADNNTIETVLMSYQTRRTLCISTQVGCPIGCAFCATGQMGFIRNLSCGEIIEQAIHFARHLKAKDEKLTNIVIMGMGEPFLNYDATMEAIDILNHPLGFNFGERRFTISTVGIIPMVEKFARQKRQVNLAISLHAADDDLRSTLIPLNKKYPIQDLMQVCEDYIRITGRRISFEWALIQNLNDTPQQAKLLAGRLKNMLCHVNIIQLNPIKGYPFKGSDRERTEAFCQELRRNHIHCTVRLRRGIDINAGCGQLASQSIKAQPNQPML